MGDLSGALTVRAGDERGVEVDEPLVMKELVDGEGHLVPDAEDGSEGVGAGSQVRRVAEELPRVAFLLERVGRVGVAEHLDALSLYLYTLPLALAFHELAFHAEACARRDALEGLLVSIGSVYDDLKISYGRAVVHGDETDLLAISAGPDPAHDRDLRACGGLAHNLNDSLWTHDMIKTMEASVETLILCFMK